MPLGVEASIGASLRHNRAFALLGLDSIMKAQRATERLMEKLDTHEFETKPEGEKIERSSAAAAVNSERAA